MDVFFVFGALDFCFLCIMSVVKNYIGKHQIVLLFTLGHAKRGGGGGVTVWGKLDYESSIRRNECTQIFHIFE